MEDRKDHINFDNINYYYKQGNKFIENPMCRCNIIIKPEDVYFTYCTGWFIWEYKEECKESLIWIN